MVDIYEECLRKNLEVFNFMRLWRFAILACAFVLATRTYAAAPALSSNASEEEKSESAVVDEVQPFSEGIKAWSNEDYDLALNIFRSSAEKGSAQSMTVLGYMYTTGNGANRDQSLGIHWYRMAIASGDVYAMYALSSYLREYPLLQEHDGEALELLKGAVDKKLPVACQEYFRVLVTEGKNDEAQTLLMNCYNDDQLWALTLLGVELTTGQGVDKNVDEGIALLKKAAARGDMSGNYYAGLAEKSRGNLDAAKEFHQAAAKNDYAPSMFELGKIYMESGQVDSAKKYLEDAGLNGYTAAYVYLGHAYEDGAHVKKDLDAAAQYYKMAADIGDGAGCNEYGRMTELGLGVTASETAAYDLYASGALNGNAESLYNQGRMELYGIGTSQDVESGIKKIQDASAHGEAAATAALARMYKRGEYLDKNESEATRLALLAAEQGDPESLFMLAQSLKAEGEKANDNEKIEQALDMFQRAALADHAPSQFALANLLSDDDWHAPDLVSALRWYTAASDNDYPPAMCAMGILRLGAAKTDTETNAAVGLIAKAAVRGYLPAEFVLGQIYEQGWNGDRDIRRAISHYRRAAEGGEIPSQLRLASLASRGEYGLSVDYAEAYKWYRKAAESGDHIAQTNLASFYAMGRGIPRDDQEAFKWYEKAAKGGSVQAQYNCAIMKMRAIGTWKDSKAAVALLQDCAAKGYAPAQNELGLLYAQGVEVERSFENARLMLTSAADAGYVPAQYNLGLLYSYSPESERDPAAAISCFELAAKAGHAAAAWHLGSAYEEGRGVEKDLLRARQYYEVAKAGGEPRAVEGLKRLRQAEH